MKLTYHPSGATEPQVYDFEPDETRESRLETLERMYSRLVGEKLMAADMLLLNAMQGQASARRVILWHVLNEVHGGKLRIEDVDPLRRELEVEASRSDLLWLRGRLSAAGGADVAPLIEGIDAQLATMADDDQGKAISPNSAAATG
jgi:hypothetical protein